MLANETIETRRSALDERAARQKVQASKFQAAEADLAAQVKKHRPATNAELASYNQAVTARNASVATFNGENSGIQRDQAALNSLIFDTNVRCGAMLVPQEIADEVDTGRRAKRGTPK